MMTTKSISVLVTRPDPSGLELAARLHQQGDKTIAFPTIDFMPPRDESQFERAIETLAEQDWLIFVSPRAVQNCVPALRRRWPILPESVRFAAVGAGTAKALREAGYGAIYPEQEWSTEGLLEMQALQSVDGQRIAIVRGEGGREKLAQELSARGALISHVIAYERVLPKVDVEPVLAAIKTNKIDLIICGSYESVRNLKILLGDQGWAFVQKIPLIVMSERVKVLTHDLDVQQVWVTKNASQDAIFELIAQKRDELCQNK